MTMPLKKSTYTKKTLKAEEAAGVLRNAVAQRVQVHFELKKNKKKFVPKGEMFSFEDSRLSIHIQDTSKKILEALSVKTFKIYFELSGGRYSFDTRLLDSSNGSTSITVVVEQPGKVLLVERRRTVRRRLRQPTVVHLSNAEDRATWKCRATMLNASEYGLACKIERVHAEALSMGQILFVKFRLGGESESFSLKASIINITDGGTDEHTVLGMEFVEHPQFEMEHQRLHDALHAS